MTSTSTPVRRIAPYGAWQSDLTVDIITRKLLTLSQVRVLGADTFWVESRTSDNGRNVLLRRRGDGQVSEILPLTPDSELVDVRSRVHEYGGKAYALASGVVVVSHGGDGCLYRFDLDTQTSELTRLTPRVSDRYSDMTIDTHRGLVWAVRERHHDDGEPTNALVGVPLDASAAREDERIVELWGDSDFVAAPALSPDGRFLAFITWSHPHMPWQQTTLRVAELTDDGTIARIVTLVDAPGVAASEPRWSPTGDLIHVDDSTGWANLYRTEGICSGKGTWPDDLHTRALHPAQREFTTPQWQLGLHSFDILDADHLITAWCDRGSWRIGTVRLDNGQLEEWPSKWSPSGNVAAADGRVVMLADHPFAFESVVEVSDGEIRVLRSSAEVAIDTTEIAVGEPLTWTSSDGGQVHGFFYSPTSLKWRAPSGELPPLITMVHGGPTAATRQGLRPTIQYWTSRGFAVLDVNYRGSTGYGSSYRDALDGKWGVLDVADCASGAQFLAEAGLVDPRRMAIRGGSAGGFTVLQTLATTDVFSAGVSHYGIADLKRLSEDTHKFESRYVYRLLGATDGDDPRFVERSPLAHVDTLDAPLLLLQGTDDTVVPPNQTEMMVEALRARGVAASVEYFDGEGHGFIRDDSRRRAALAELAFYRKVWGIPTPDTV
ncbi:S9 family peptidase [Nanchangia anserum]|uniref:S9 family peptidase n=1 Tax=Nanchangia anserum TaxID=2692125 RepID=A0A8I0KPE8_9ACTO|nr:prolyl oligopeptidase family serine peptidase [Nanchangia anserum]MBD3688820.1 S9 family peptidase [Nanchangia anserum]QOX81097.1 S9 family peptidase [Nanchangia anserum]